MPQLTSQQLRRWYGQFAKALYEKANIDINCKEDLGRVKNFYFTKWDDDEPMGPEGEYRYAYIAHDGLTYNNPPPGIENPDEYMRWISDNLNPAETDEQIEKLYEMSQAGTLMVFAPGSGYRDLQQVYTDEFGKISVSMPLSKMDGSGKNRPDVADEYKLPLPPAALIPEAIPEQFGLRDCPQKPVPPKDPNPGFLSWLGYIFGMNTEYAKKVRYEKEAPTYEERFNKWFNDLDDSKPGVSEYKEARHLREQYLQEVQDFKSKPLGLANAIDNGYCAMIKNRLQDVEEMDADGLYPTMKLMVKEQEYMKSQNGKLPQGRLLKQLENITDKLQYGDRTRRVVKNLIGNEPQPRLLTAWIKRGVFDPEAYKPKKYDLPKPPENANLTIDEQEDFQKNMQNLAEVASFAALSHVDNIIKSIFTEGVPQSESYIEFLDPARQKGREAVEAYSKGDVELLAELLRNGIRQTNVEAASLTTPDNEHGMNTLYLIGRMWNVMQKDSKLMDAVGLTPQETSETQANVEFHKTMTRALEAKQAILEYTLYKREMTPEQLKQAGCEILFENMVYKNVVHCQKNQTDVNEFKMNLLNTDWVKGVKYGLLKDCKLDDIISMKREDLGRLLNSRTNFEDTFAPVSHAPQKEQATKQTAMEEIQNKVDASVINGMM